MLKKLLLEFKKRLLNIKETKQEKIIKEPNYLIISKINNIYQIEVTKDISIKKYCDDINELNPSLLNEISNNILWNSDIQGIKKGTYYSFYHNNRKYNILINDEVIEIDERIKDKDETIERIIKFNPKNNDYHYFSCRHDKCGSTYETKYYAKEKTLIPAFELNHESFLKDFNNILSNLKTHETINKIIDFSLLKESILNNVKQKKLN